MLFFTVIPARPRARPGGWWLAFLPTEDALFWVEEEGVLAGAWPQPDGEQRLGVGLPVWSMSTALPQTQG